VISKIFAAQLQNINSLSLHFGVTDTGFELIEFDSRDISVPTETLFVCLVGQKTNGHLYIDELIEKGVKYFLISDKKYISKKGNFILCPDTLQGFQTLAGLNRKQFNNNVIAITGSNGKTIVKEWLSQLLSTRFKVCKSPLSYNSQIGVPYSVAKLKDQELGLFEVGVSKLGEMQNLQSIVEPNIGIFTTIGDAHSEGFESIAQKIEEKLILFKNVHKLVYCNQQANLSAKIEQYLAPERRLSWGKKADIDVVWDTTDQRTKITIDRDLFEVDFIDEASLQNVTHAIVTALYLGVSSQQIQYGLSLLRNVDMRFEIKEGQNGNLLLNDSYNNDLSGLKMTLDLAKKMNKNQPMVLLASDFLDQNTSTTDWQKELKQVIASSNLSEICWVGKQAPQLSKISHFAATKELAIYLEEKKHQNTFFIIKGARPFNFEQLVDGLEVKQHITRVEVNLSRLVQNYNYYKSTLTPTTKIMVMVKAFAYGTGIVEVAKLLEMNGVDYLAVAYTDEGILLRQSGVKTPIMVMNVLTEDLDNLVKYKLEPEIFALHQLAFFYAKTSQLTYHLKLDTGMHRLGFDKNTINELYAYLQENKGVKVQSILTHLASADSQTDDGYTQKQLTVFENYSTEIEKILGYKTLKHALNSAGITRFSHAQYNMVRLGIGIYGFGVMPNSPLKQVISLKTHVSQLRKLTKSETIGYNRKGKLTRDSIIATIPIGYADGFDRRFSNGVGEVLINGKLAPVVGNVCMDMTMIDVTDVHCKEGDEVIIYSDLLPVDRQAQKIGTISYELLTHLSERVRRIFYFE
jgi:Alr-MurF fusion protein